MIDAAKEHFPFEKSQINFIWKLARGIAVNPDAPLDYATKKKGNFGQKQKHIQEDVITTIGQTPLSQRQTLRTLSNMKLIPTWTLI